MSLDLKPLHLQRVIMECLNIESFEHCYFIPVLAQTAEYWGDAQVASTCNLMSQQVKEYFDHAAHVHFYLAKQHRHLNQNFSVHDQYYAWPNTIKAEKRQKDQKLSQYQGDIFDSSNEINRSLKSIHGTHFFLNKYEKEKKYILKSLEEIDNNLWEISKKIEVNLERKNMHHNIQKPLSSMPRNFLDHDDFFLLLKILRHRKIWKSTRWYPLVSKLTSNEKMFHISRLFMQTSQSEREVSRLLMELMHR